MHAFILLPILLLVIRPVVAAMPLAFEEADIEGDSLISTGEAANAIFWILRPVTVMGHSQWMN
ncbi:MAG TPA: hypothetical protein DEP36_16450 [Gammaproteobacteria bacterium]|nr:hypothetical protein [Gammaproteobacteria bacterium]HRF43403.1 hypothetical protein [Candidatus Competibacteraceae bacterium]